MAENKDVRNTRSCLVCRSRKVRCDRSAPTCHNCGRIGIKCPGYNDSISKDQLKGSVEGIFRASGVEKRRVGSCEACRRTKSKCSRVRPACQRCLQKFIPCIYSEDHGTEDSSLSISIDISTYTWMYKSSLPESRSLATGLLEIYFERVHTLRCLGFIHKPTFKQSLDQGLLFDTYGEPLIYIMCALGSRIFFEDNFDQLSNEAGPIPGEQWADRARDAVLKDIARPSVANLMAMLLTCEYASRAGQNALAFMLVGCCCRMVQLLGLDSETKTIDSATQLEIERRVLWSSYVLDSFLGSGVDGNLYWRDEAPRAPLPCPDSDFLSQTHTLRLATIDDPLSSTALDPRACLIHMARFRTRVLRLIRKDRLTTEIWDDQSPFLALIRQLELWYDHLPDQFRITESNPLESHVVGSIYMLHLFYHSVMTDLTRVSLPGFDFPLAALFRSTTPLFRRQYQERCRFHADEISRLARSGLQVGRNAFDDPHCAMAAFESTKIQIIHTTTTTPNSVEDRQKAEENIRINLELANCIHFSKDKANIYLRALLPLLSKFGFEEIALEWRQSMIAVPEPDTEVTGPAETNYLSNLSSFRLAKSELQARQDSNNSSNQMTAAGHSPTPLMPSVVPGTSNPSHAQIFIEQQETPVQVTDQLIPYSEIVPSNLSNSAGELEAENYARLAGEMSDYITWEATDLPSWIDFNNYNFDYQF